jgi:hypothetical protein
MPRPLHIVNRSAILILAMAFAAWAQAPQAPAKAPAKAAPPAKAPAQKPAPKPAPTAKPAAKAAPAPEEPKKEEEATSLAAAGKRRDPFLSLVLASAGNGAPIHLPPGKAGLQVSTLRVDGIVRSQNGMLVVVTSPQGRTYFLHQGDRLFDGRVEQVNMDGVTFQETGKDPFGKTIERNVVKRIYPSAGEQQ